MSRLHTIFKNKRNVTLLKLHIYEKLHLMEFLQQDEYQKTEYYIISSSFSRPLLDLGLFMYPIHTLQEATSMSLCFVSAFGRESRDKRGDAIQSTTLTRECGCYSLASPRLVPRQCEAPRESLYEASEMRFWTTTFRWLDEMV